MRLGGGAKAEAGKDKEGERKGMMRGTHALEGKELKELLRFGEREI